jgi:hypothetical protein
MCSKKFLVFSKFVVAVVVAVIVGNIPEQVVEFVVTVEQCFVLFVQIPVIACSSERRFVLELVGIVEHFAAQFVVIAEQVVGFVEETVVPVEQLAEFVVAYSSLLNMFFDYKIYGFLV